MVYKKLSLKQEFIIEQIVTVHYFEYMSDFSFPGESHDFWEFLCVDKGEVNITAGHRTYCLKKGDIIFHKPNEFHSVSANGILAPNLVVISFNCASPSMDFFKNKVFTISETERTLLAQIIQEAKEAFDCRLDDPYMEKLTRASIPPFGSEQLIKIHLEALLVYLTRRYSAPHTAAIQKPLPFKSMKRRNDDQIYSRVLLYLEENIHTHLTIETICRDNLVGRSQLQKLFRDRNSCGIIDHFSRMKINAAKEMIRAKTLNFSQISDALGYTSVHYFSRQFKHIAGMTPSEYASSIKLLSEKPEALSRQSKGR